MRGARPNRCAATAVLALVAAIGAGAAPVSAQTIPNRPITLVVPFPPGGSTTIIARIIADRLGDALGQQKRLALEGGEPIAGAPEAYAADIAREQMRWSKLVNAIGLRIE